MLPDRVGRLDKKSESMIREFHISDVLSVVYDAVLSTRGYDGVCELLDFVKSLYTLQNPQAIREYGPVLVRQHPFLDDPRIHFAIAKLREMLLAFVSSSKRFMDGNISYKFLFCLNMG